MTAQTIDAAALWADLQAVRRSEPGSLIYWEQLDRGTLRLSVSPWFMSVDLQRTEVAWLQGQDDVAAARAPRRPSISQAATARPAASTSQAQPGSSAATCTEAVS